MFVDEFQKHLVMIAASSLSSDVSYAGKGLSSLFSYSDIGSDSSTV